MQVNFSRTFRPNKIFSSSLQHFHALRFFMPAAVRPYALTPNRENVRNFLLEKLIDPGFKVNIALNSLAAGVPGSSLDQAPLNGPGRPLHILVRSV